LYHELTIFRSLQETRGFRYTKNDAFRYKKNDSSDRHTVHADDRETQETSSWVYLLHRTDYVGGLETLVNVHSVYHTHGDDFSGSHLTVDTIGDHLSGDHLVADA